MDSSVQLENVHSRGCANRYTMTALMFVAFCALGLVMSWGVLGQENVHHNTSRFFGDLIAIVVLAQVFTTFSCLRERLVLGLLLTRFGVGLVVKFVPALSSQVGDDLLKRATLVLWTLALLVSLSMLYSALRFRPLTSQTK